MTTFDDLIESTRQHLMTGQPDRLNVLDANIDNAVDELVLRYEAKGVGEGSTIVCGLEEMHVVGLSSTGGSTTLTVIRGFGGSSPAAHTAGDFIFVNPQFSTFKIAQAVNQALHNVSGDGLFRIANVTVTADTTKIGYPVNIVVNEFIDMWKARYSVIGSSDEWPTLRNDEYWLDLNADTTTFPPNGVALFIRGSVRTGESIRLSYKRRFSQLVNLNDDVLAVSGLHTEAHDLPPMDAAISLLTGREVKRSFLNRQPEPRRAEEVPPGTANQSMLPLLRRYEERIGTEIRRLNRLYPLSI